MTDEELPKEQITGPGWRIRGQRGVIGRTVGRSAKTITTIVGNVKLPEISEQGSEPMKGTSPSKQVMRPFFAAVEEPQEEVPDFLRKSAMVDADKKREKGKRTRIL